MNHQAMTPKATEDTGSFSASASTAGDWALDLAHVDMQGYVGDLTRTLLRTYGAAAAHVQLEVEANNVSLSMDAALPWVANRRAARAASMPASPARAARVALSPISLPSRK